MVNRKRKKEDIEDTEEDLESSDFDDDYDIHDYKRPRKLPKILLECKKYIKNTDITLEEIAELECHMEERSNLLQLYNVWKCTPRNTLEYLDIRSKLVNDYKKLKDRNPEIKNILDMFPEDNVESKILKLNTTYNNKYIILQHYMKMGTYSTSSEEYPKMKGWLDHVLKLPFDNMKPFQAEVSSFLKHIKYLLDDRIYGLEKIKDNILMFMSSRIKNPNNTRSNMALVGPPGVGKCLARGTKVLMYSGGLVNVENIKLGDKLMGDDSNVRIVTNVTRGKETMYSVKQKDGSVYTVNESHILTLMYNNINNHELYPVDIEIKEYLKLPKHMKSMYLGYRANVNFDTGNDTLFPKVVAINYIEDGKCDIPESYIYTDINTRSIILKTILDAFHTGDMFYIENFTEIRTYDIVRNDNTPHTYNFIHLLHSLGLKTIQPNSSCVTISPNDIMYNLFDIDICEEGVDDYYGFTLEGGNHRFLLGDFTVTHNTMIARTLSDIIHIPFSQISMGGIQDVSYLKGHDYTYIGSQPGEIVKTLSKHQCKNGLILLDEFDKISDNKNITSLLLHILDPLQNHEFKDNFIGDINIDLSSVFFIMSMNEIPTNKALSDRLFIIEIEGYTTSEKVEIIRRHIIRKALADHKLDVSSVQISKRICKYIIDTYTSGEKGIRKLEKIIYEIVQKLVLLHTIGTRHTLGFNISQPVVFPITLTEKLVNELMKH